MLNASLINHRWMKHLIKKSKQIANSWLSCIDIPHLVGTYLTNRTFLQHYTSPAVGDAPPELCLMKLQDGSTTADLR